MHKAQSKTAAVSTGAKVVLDEAGFAQLFKVLAKVGYETIGPRVRDGAVVYEEISSPNDLPIGVSDEQDGGHYRLVKGAPGAYFEYVVGPTSWKKYLFPPRQKLLDVARTGNGFKAETVVENDVPYAFIGVRPCELAAIRIQDKVFGYDPENKSAACADPGYCARRSKVLLVAVNCSRAAKTCFCESMGTGPQAKKDQGYDLLLTEILDKEKHFFVMESGSKRGSMVLDVLPKRKATDEDLRAEENALARARRQISKAMPPDVDKLLKKNLEHPRWEEVAKRCLTCANCTMACPTCFCNTVEEATDLTGDHAERWRLWDSCFSVDFSYIHGGAVRPGAFSRYRQWMTHKLSNWHDQFGTSGCVGCGRCITWCPVGIDITEEAKAIKYTSR